MLLLMALMLTAIDAADADADKIYLPFRYLFCFSCHVIEMPCYAAADDAAACFRCRFTDAYAI